MDVVIANLPLYLEGFGVTLLLLLVGGLGALVLGTIVAAMRISPIATLRGIATVYTEIIRNTPLTLVVIFAVVIVPLLGPRVPFILSGFIALAVYTSPFVAEALRSGINGVPIGQAEAARSLGLGFAQTISLIVFPQAFRMTIPPLINVFIALAKNTSVVGGVGFVAELFGVGRTLANANGNAVIAILIGVAVFYLIITVPLGFLATQLERKWVVQR
ncbi:amino acid ABC transporter permease [Agromyces aerolatus]|uniref:amino acid ABC transporter permease n=1 Tax=Agromyces sp. LY-1074 TaxID=3074080 RepID=UPI0028634E05|nr:MULTISPECIES: amino acid ABC transporter permease [unclassified Agromyces]MDR5700991.1 amino acid ABC transporter permease [Agromyces sp. LY-1074]MDR5707631.1 amino acid ABC transporter permease [Agromyces sp. LY-1358]